MASRPNTDNTDTEKLQLAIFNKSDSVTLKRRLAFTEEPKN